MSAASVMSAFALGSRIVASLIGSYVFAWGFSALVVAAGLVSGASYREALQLAYLLAFLVFLATFLWAFSSASVVRVWLVLAGGGLAMTAAVWWLTPRLT